MACCGGGRASRGERHGGTGVVAGRGLDGWWWGCIGDLFELRAVARGLPGVGAVGSELPSWRDGGGGGGDVKRGFGCSDSC